MERQNLYKTPKAPMVEKEPRIGAGSQKMPTTYPIPGKAPMTEAIPGKLPIKEKI